MVAALECYEAIRPVEAGFTLEQVREAIYPEISDGRLIDRVCNRLTPKPKTTEERLQDISKAYASTLNQEMRIKYFTELEALCGELLKVDDVIAARLAAVQKPASVHFPHDKTDEWEKRKDAATQKEGE
jgi:hypothetical protein